MSRRFGRNQRRRARETLALAVAENASQRSREESLQAINGGLRRRADEMAADLHVLNDAMDRARKVLGHHFALPPIHWGDHPHPLGGNFHARVDDYSLARGPQRAQLSAKAKAVEMCTLLGAISKQRDRFTDDLHFYVTLDSGEVAYCIAADTIYRTDSASLIESLTKEIGELAAEELVKNLRRGARRA